MSFYPLNPNLGQQIQGAAGVAPYDLGFWVIIRLHRMLFRLWLFWQRPR